MNRSPRDPAHRVLLVSLREPDDPMATHEARCFATHLDVPVQAIHVHPMPVSRPHRLEGYDLVVFGGSGAFSVLDHTEVRWIAEAVDLLLEVVDNVSLFFPVEAATPEMQEHIVARCRAAGVRV